MFLFAFISIGSIVLCFYNSIAQDCEIYYQDLFVIGIIISVLSLVALISILDISNILVTDEEIIRINVFSGRRTSIRFDEINKIESSLKRMQGEVYYVNDGYFERVIKSASGKTIKISPDHLENSDQILKFILSKYRNEV